MKLKIKYKALLSLCLLMLPLFSLAGDAANALFQKGNALYAKGNYQQALNAYKQIADGGNQSATLFFNMGNAYYKLSDIPSAILYYEKAHKLSPGDEDINANIHFANLKTTDKLDPAPEFFVTSWWHGLILLFSADTLSLLGALLFTAGFLVLSFYLLSNSIALKKLSFYSGIVLIVAGVVSIFLCNRQLYYFSKHHQAIIFSSTVTAKSSPAESAKALFTIHEGAKVKVLSTANNWAEIELPNGSTGWIPASGAKEI